jgi:hypothetical protein
MADHPNELNKLTSIATDLELSADMRIRAIDLLGNIGTHSALLVLLDIAGREELTRDERELALKRSKEIIKSGH